MSYIVSPATPEIQKAKDLAAKAAVDSVELKDQMAIGIGSGSTVVFAVRHLEQKCADLGGILYFVLITNP